jgi:hypothetical protein
MLRITHSTPIDTAKKIEEKISRSSIQQDMFEAQNNNNGFLSSSYMMSGSKQMGIDDMM